MGIIICEEHGRQGIVHVCDHIRADILTGGSTVDCVITGEEVLEYFGNVPVAFTVGYCDACAKQYGLPLHGGVLPESISDPPTEFGNQIKPVCAECFKVLKESVRPCQSE